MAGDLEIVGNNPALEVVLLAKGLQQAETPTEVRHVFDRAQAFLDVAKRARLADDQLRVYAAISLRAQRLGGLMLKATPRAEGRPSADKPSLSMLLGLPRDKARHLAEDWLKVAEIEEYVFENYLAQRDKIPTFKGLLRFRGPGPKRRPGRPRKDGTPPAEASSEPRQGLRLVPDKEIERPTAVHPSILAAQAEAWNACVAWFAAQTSPRIPDRLLLEAEDANPYDHAVTRPGHA